MWPATEQENRPVAKTLGRALTPTPVIHTMYLQGDPSGWLKPLIDLDLVSSAILPGQ